MRYTLKTGRCAVCGDIYTGLISDENISQNICPAHRQPLDISHAQSLHFRTFTPHFDRGLWSYVNTEGQRQRLIKEKGFIEVGNELDYMKAPENDTPVVTENEFYEKVKEVEQRFPNSGANDAENFC